MKIILTSRPLWSVIAATMLGFMAKELAESTFLPFGAATNIATLFVVIAGILVLTANIVRRVTPVLDTAVGVSPVADNQPVTLREQNLMRDADLSLPKDGS